MDCTLTVLERSAKQKSILIWNKTGSYSASSKAFTPRGFDESLQYIPSLIGWHSWSSWIDWPTYRPVKQDTRGLTPPRRYRWRTSYGGRAPSKCPRLRKETQICQKVSMVTDWSLLGSS
ncbi:hypothetical protein M378DRAFT_169006 [Amanita muscaria Koide BX008]|uniref:Uncharacterized protein n=1 Tax=Amanita muscaria (strain Koide BX008) TaxID=946122 RepID=A0A0C2WEB3_AMAMK|nr:hypothetical protein M378DRAFT_169006 [Amanita muscaria Koide BX008]